jgi:hypothetical protein
MQGELIFLSGNIPSLKNSKVMGRFPSKTVMRWLRLYGIQGYNSGRKEVKFFKRIPKQYDFEEICKSIKECNTYPLKLGFHFVRGSRHKWDFHNPCHILLDLMTAFDIIPDDNVEYVLPFPLEIDGKYWSYNKEAPGVYIKIIE